MYGFFYSSQSSFPLENERVRSSDLRAILTNIFVSFLQLVINYMHLFNVYIHIETLNLITKRVHLYRWKIRFSYNVHTQNHMANIP